VHRAARRHPPSPGAHRPAGAAEPRPGDHQHGHARGDRRPARAGACEHRAGRTGLMAETVQETADEIAETPPISRLCLCEQYVRVTEGAALTAARWLGRADQEAAERDAAEAMRRVLDDFPIDGRVVIGSEDEESPLHVGGSIGAGGAEADLALDPLEGRGVVARGGNGAMSMIAVGPPASVVKLPDMYMRRLAVGPRVRGRIDLLRPVGENLQVLADSFGRNGNDISNGDLLRGVRFLADSARTHSLIMCMRCNWVRFTDGIHFFARERREEVRLLGY